MNVDKPMRKNLERDLEILTAIGEGPPVTQRDRAERLGVALGLTNIYLKRLARKGFIKITDFPRKPAARKRLRYLLTPEGISEKIRLTYEHVYLTLTEFGLEPVGVFSRDGAEAFLGFPVRRLADIPGEEIDGVVVATFDAAEGHVAELLAIGVPPEKLLTLRRSSALPTGEGAQP